MKQVLTVALVGVSLLAWAVQPAAAQRPPGGGGFGGGGLGALAQNPGVAKEIKLSEEQTTQLREAVQKVREKHKDELDKIREGGREGAREKMAELSKTMNPEIEKAIGDVLKPDQLKRLKQIDLQNQGIVAFQKPEVQEALKLTKEQQDKVKDLDADLRKSIEESFKDGQGDRTKLQEAMKKVGEVRKQTLEKATSLLSDTQKKAWKDLTGDPYEVKFERPARPKNDI